MLFILYIIFSHGFVPTPNWIICLYFKLNHLCYYLPTSTLHYIHVSILCADHIKLTQLRHILLATGPTRSTAMVYFLFLVRPLLSFRNCLSRRCWLLDISAIQLCVFVYIDVSCYLETTENYVLRFTSSAHALISPNLNTLIVSQQIVSFFHITSS